MKVKVILQHGNIELKDSVEVDELGPVTLPDGMAATLSLDTYNGKFFFADREDVVEYLQNRLVTRMDDILKDPQKAAWLDEALGMYKPFRPIMKDLKKVENGRIMAAILKVLVREKYTVPECDPTVEAVVEWFKSRGHLDFVLKDAKDEHPYLKKTKHFLRERRELADSVYWFLTHKEGQDD